MRQLIKKIISPLLKKISAIYLSKSRKYTYKNIAVWVEPTVFPPFITISTKLLLELVETLSLKDKTFLELGCGCGIIAVLAAKKGAKTTATDINNVAISALKKNMTTNNVEIEVLYSDLFEKLSSRIFDYIVINPPYYPKKPQSMAENAWFCGENFEYFEALWQQLPAFISQESNIFMILSEDCALDKIKTLALNNNIVLNLVSEQKVLAEKNYIFRVEFSKNGFLHYQKN